MSEEKKETQVVDDPNEAAMLASWLEEDEEALEGLDVELPESSDEGEEPVEAKADEGEEDWQEKFNRLKQERDGILTDLQSERQRSKEARQEYEEARARHEARLAALEQKFGKASGDEEDQEPDKDQDPVAYLEWKQAKDRERLERLEQEAEQFEQFEAQALQRQQELQALQAAEQAYLSSEDALDPQIYHTALLHARRVVANMVAPEAKSEAELLAEVARRERQTSMALLQQGKNPAVEILEFARQTGWSEEKGQEWLAEMQGEKKESPKQEAKPKEKKPGFKPDPKFSAAKTLNSARGPAAVEKGWTLDDLDSMPDGVFDEIQKDPKLWAAFNKGEAVHI